MQENKKKIAYFLIFERIFFSSWMKKVPSRAEKFQSGAGHFNFRAENELDFFNTYKAPIFFFDKNKLF